MLQKMKDFFPIFKIVITCLAVLNLLLLFVFEYKFPFLDFSKELSKPPVVGQDDETNAGEDVAPELSIAFHFTQDSLSYDGSSSLDLLEGVSLVSSDASPVDSEIFVHILTGDSLNEKIIEYTADTSLGQVTAQRPLVLKSYDGPSISLPEEFPPINAEHPEGMLAVLLENQLIVAEDGFGKDISNGITSEYTIDTNNSSLAHYTFSITNMFNDVFVASADVLLDDGRPILALKQNEVTISRYSYFYSISYVAKAEDRDGNSLFHRISVDGRVDVNTPGTYVLTYTTIDQQGQQSHPQVLTVTVE